MVKSTTPRTSGALGLVTLVIITALMLSGVSRAQDAVSNDGLYRIAYTAELSPIVINRIHRWTLHLHDRNGAPVSGATMTVTGGMPEHNHGLPTRPVVTRDLGDGDYALEGMRFHMSGYWEITVSIDGPAGKDSAVIRLDIQANG